MRTDYQDIRSRIAEEPTWYDENGCPRYGTFYPAMCSGVYAKVAVLLEIDCQDCGQRFMVAMTECPWFPKDAYIEQSIKDKTLHYGDPPRHLDHNGDDCVGGTMNCGDLRIVEYWDRDWGWMRKPEMEVVLWEIPE
jgi:hypothetical protein